MKKYRWNWKKCVSNMLFLAEIIIVLWAIISLLQIWFFNLSDDPYSHYSAWNLWTLFTQRS